MNISCLLTPSNSFKRGVMDVSGDDLFMKEKLVKGEVARRKLNYKPIFSPKIFFEVKSNRSLNIHPDRPMPKKN